MKTGIYIRVQVGGEWGAYDIADPQVTNEQVLAWLRSRGGKNAWAEDCVLAILGRRQAAARKTPICKECANMNRKLLATREKDKDTAVVLYELLENFDERYVTWLATKTVPVNTLWGHYFYNVVDAVHDFDKR